MARILQNVKKVISDDAVGPLDEKLRLSKMILSRPPEKGGAPFIYAFTCIKNHFLEDEKVKIELGKDANGQPVYFYTAATDGVNYYWHPKMLERLTPEEISIITSHETYHIVYQHCNHHRSMGKNRKIWNIAVDYVVNASIEHDYRQAGRINNYSNYNTKGSTHPLWKGGLGAPLLFKDFIASLDKQAKKAKASGKPPVHRPITQKDVDNAKMFADYTMYGKSAEEIYNEIMAHVPPGSGGSGGGGEGDGYIWIEGDDGPGIAIVMDDHRDVDMPRGKLLQEIMDAATQARQLAGKLPAGVEEQLGILSEPKLKWQDIVRHALQSARQDKGSKNDWTRMRHRAIGMGLYIPKKKDQFVRWLCMLDTSGSMSQDDMAYGISQLKALDGRSKGTVVPCDAQVYWDKATDIMNVDNLQNVKICGRGGTCFFSFFEDWNKHFREQIDVMIILTDGGIFDLDKLRKPNCDVVWVLTNNCDFHPPFGRVAPLRGSFK